MDSSPVQHEVLSNGDTVWVNSGETGHCLGRFSRWGIDIHRDMEKQDKLGQCLNCTHHKPSPEEWDIFVAEMKKHYGVEIGNMHRPLWLRRIVRGNQETNGRSS